MNLAIIPILLVLLSTQETVAETSSPECRIVGGSDAPSETWYPSIVSIGATPVDYCGATILNKIWLLTAAHCAGITGFEPGEIVIAGNPFKCPDGQYEQKRHIAKYFAHEEYKRAGHLNDIALYQLDEPLEFSPAVQPVKLISKDFKVPDNTLVTAVGWGYTGANKKSDEPPQRLQHVDVPILSTETCVKVFQQMYDHYKYHPGMICAGYMEEGGKDTCQGDSGGPVYATESGKPPPSQTPWQEHFQVGITSFGEGCARPEYPGFYTKVQYYLDWIEKTMRENRHSSELSSSSANSCAFQKASFVLATILAVKAIRIK